MSGCTREAFGSIMKLLKALYPESKAGTQATSEAYYLVLSDLPVEMLKAAVLQLVATDDTGFFPRAGAIRKAAYKLVEEQNDVPDYADAWNEVISAIGKYGYLNKPKFSNPMIWTAIGEMPGWLALCKSEEKDIAITKAQFRNTFNLLLERERKQARMLPQVKALAERFAGHGLALEAGHETPTLVSAGLDTD